MNEARGSLGLSTPASTGYISVTRTITYTYDPLGRLTDADYSTGEAFEYAYDGVGNRAAMTETVAFTGTQATSYEYDAANRLTSAGGVTYTWDDRGNLTNDGVFTYTYNAAGRLVRAESVTNTLVYTYNADGLRVAQSVDDDETTFAWNTALPLAQVLATSDGSLDLYGLSRIAEVRGSDWAYALPDALGSVRQWTDGGGYVTYAGGYTPYGRDLWQEGDTASAWGYTGEWNDSYIEFTYLRARWHKNQIGQFVSPDPIVPDFHNPQSINRYSNSEFGLPARRKLSSRLILLSSGAHWLDFPSPNLKISGQRRHIENCCNRYTYALGNSLI